MVVEVNHLGPEAVHLFGVYDSNWTKIHSNGFLSACNTVAGGGDSPLVDQLLGVDPAIPAGETGSQWMRDPNSPYSGDLADGRVADEAVTISS